MLLTRKDKDVLVSILKGCKPTTMVTKYINLLSDDDSPHVIKGGIVDKIIDNATVVFKDLPKDKILAIKEIRNSTGLNLKGCLAIYEIFLVKGVILASDISKYYLREKERTKYEYY